MANAVHVLYIWAAGMRQRQPVVIWQLVSTRDFRAVFIAVSVSSVRLSYIPLSHCTSFQRLVRCSTPPELHVPSSGRICCVASIAWPVYVGPKFLKTVQPS